LGGDKDRDQKKCDFTDKNSVFPKNKISEKGIRRGLRTRGGQYLDRA